MSSNLIIYLLSSSDKQRTCLLLSCDFDLRNPCVIISLIVLFGRFSHQLKTRIVCELCDVPSGFGSVNFKWTFTLPTHLQPNIFIYVFIDLFFFFLIQRALHALPVFLPRQSQQPPVYLHGSCFLGGHSYSTSLAPCQGCLF